MDKQITVSHVDTCLGCYLTDHHSRPGQLLVGVECNGQSAADALEELAGQVSDLAPEEFWSLTAGQHEPWRQAASEAIAGLLDASGAFPDDNQPTAGEDADPCRAWFLVQF
jgi:hypothetical protein